MQQNASATRHSTIPASAAKPANSAVRLCASSTRAGGAGGGPGGVSDSEALADEVEAGGGALGDSADAMMPAVTKSPLSADLTERGLA